MTSIAAAPRYNLEEAVKTINPFPLDLILVIISIQFLLVYDSWEKNKTANQNLMESEIVIVFKVSKEGVGEGKFKFSLY